MKLEINLARLDRETVEGIAKLLTDDLTRFENNGSASLSEHAYNAIHDELQPVVTKINAFLAP